jgi:hypothetical protein
MAEIMIKGADPALEFFPDPKPAPADAKNPLSKRPPPIPEATKWENVEPEMRAIMQRGMAGKPRLGS